MSQVISIGAFQQTQILNPLKQATITIKNIEKEITLIKEDVQLLQLFQTAVNQDISIHGSFQKDQEDNQKLITQLVQKELLAPVDFEESDAQLLQSVQIINNQKLEKLDQKQLLLNKNNDLLQRLNSVILELIQIIRDISRKHTNS